MNTTAESPVDTHKCPIPNCLTLVERKYLMCPTDWHMISPMIQQAVLDGWRTLLRDKKPEEYRAARLQAINDVVTKISRSASR